MDTYSVDSAGKGAGTAVAHVPLVPTCTCLDHLGLGMAASGKKLRPQSTHYTVHTEQQRDEPTPELFPSFASFLSAKPFWLTEARNFWRTKLQLARLNTYRYACGIRTLAKVRIDG